MNHSALSMPPLTRLRVVKKLRRRLLLGHRTAGTKRTLYSDRVGSYDFVVDLMVYGKTLKCLTVIDKCTREASTIQVERSLTLQAVINPLRELLSLYGKTWYQIEQRA